MMAQNPEIQPKSLVGTVQCPQAFQSRGLQLELGKRQSSPSKKAYPRRKKTSFYSSWGRIQNFCFSPQMIVSTTNVRERLTPSSSSWSKRRQKKHVFGLNSLDLQCALALGAPRKVLKVSSPAGSSLEMKPGARVACRVTMAVAFLLLLVTAIAFAGECRGAHHGDNVSVPSKDSLGHCTWAKSSPVLLTKTKSRPGGVLSR